jgi:hypothetical protein
MNTAEQRARRRQKLRAEMERHRDRTFRAAPSWRTRARRRSLVAVVLLAVVASMISIHLAPRSFLLSVGGLFLVACVPLVGLRVLTRGVAESPDSQLDERDRTLRDGAVRRSYFLLIAAAALLTGYVAITEHAPDLGSRVMSLLVTIAWSAAMAPTLLLAWTLPDDDPEDLVGR